MKPVRRVKPEKPDQHRLRRAAVWMNLMFIVQRHRGVTRTGMAELHHTHGCNVSAYTSSKGSVLNLSREKIFAILLDLGVHPDGVLAPGLHRWQFPSHLSAGDMELQDALGDLLVLNPPLDPACPPRCVVWQDSDVGFLLHRPARVAVVLACLSMAQIDRLRERADIGVVFESVSHGEASELQTLMSTSDPAWVVERSIDSYLSPQAITGPLRQAAVG